MGPGEGEQVVTVSKFTARTGSREAVRVRVRRPAAVSELRTATCPSSCPRPSRTRREDRRSSCPTSRPLLSGLVQASDPAGRSPGYCRSTRCSSSAESPRPSRRWASSSAPARKAARSCRLRWQRCSAAATEGSGCGFTVSDSLAPTAQRCDGVAPHSPTTYAAKSATFRRAVRVAGSRRSLDGSFCTEPLVAYP